jgi:hypothetical protein
MNNKDTEGCNDLLIKAKMSILVKLQGIVKLQAPGNEELRREIYYSIIDDTFKDIDYGLYRASKIEIPNHNYEQTTEAQKRKYIKRLSWCLQQLEAIDNLRGNDEYSTFNIKKEMV